jgi:thiol:disulfide interchange protein DsbD
MKKAFAAIGVLTLLALPAAAQLGGAGLGWGEEGAAGGPKVEASAAIDTAAVTGGKPFTLAITLKTNPGWHVYWSNPGESGIATSFAVELPPGFTAGPVQFPLPKKFVVPGDVTCYGHEGTSTFLVKITPPAEVPPGLPPIKVKATWLNCTEAQCVPGDATLTVPLKPGGLPGATEGLFAAARAVLPGAPMELLREAPQARVTPDVTGKIAYTCALMFKGAPKKVEAFPDAVEGLDVSGIQIVSAEGSATISLSARLLKGQHLKVDTLPLVVVATEADGRRRGFTLPVSLRDLQDPGTK